MLVIVNPYATTMSDRIKSLVVYALQGRYDVAGGRHAGQGPRDRAVPRGRARGLRRRRRVRRRRHGQRGRQRPRRLPHPADLPAGRRHQRLRPHARHPRRRRRRHRAPARARRRLARAPRRPRPARRPPLHVLGRHGARRQRGRARRPQPAPEGALRALVLRPVGDPHVPRALRRAPAAARGRGRRPEAARRQRVRPERRRVHVLPDAPRSTSPGDSELDSGDLSGAVLTRASPIDVPTHRLPRALQARPRSPATARSSRSAASSEVRIRSVDGRPVPVQVDGDHISDEVEVRFAVEPHGAAASSADPSGQDGCVESARSQS